MEAATPSCCSQDSKKREGLSAASSTSERPEDGYPAIHPAQQMIQFWLFCIMLPAALLAWTSTKKWWVVLGATFFGPIFAIVQGAVGILTYRVWYGDSPIPLSPSHGVVQVHPEDKATEKNGGDLEPSIESATPPFSLGCVCQPYLTTGRTTTPITLGGGLGRTGFPRQPEKRSNDQQGTALPRTAETSTTENESTPLRLLVIGDSLAVGVGQAKSCTPVMPEVIAKTLSKRMGGRVVYWTCHGATGASTGWVVRELERGVDYLKEEEDGGDDTTSMHDEEFVVREARSAHCFVGDHDEEDKGLEALPSQVDSQSTCSDTDGSSSDGSVDFVKPPSISYVDTGVVKDEVTLRARNRLALSVWRERLKQHRKRFDPEFLGPYDIAVVLTGPNDLKSAVFPFLLTGEDAEFRRQARTRGGDYSTELRRLFDTLNRKMHQGLQTFCESVEEITESVRECVEETMERITHSGRSSNPSSPSKSELRSRFANAANSEGRNGSLDDTATANDNAYASKKNPAPSLPMIVLLGMPARALPIFQHVPLRWLAVPFTDIMDMHKRDFARAHPDQILFVEAPTEEQLAMYVDGEGENWRQKCNEDVVLALRDVRRRDCRRVEQAMHAYFGRKGSDALLNNPFKAIRTHLFGMPPGSHLKAFSADGVHPNDYGYDFWGRHIANAICNKWEERKI